MTVRALSVSLRMVHARGQCTLCDVNSTQAATKELPLHGQYLHAESVVWVQVFEELKIGKVVKQMN